ncbi:MAG: GNAT family N-acetyltransferase [Rhodothalassiaceae bacterium]
MSVSVDPAGPDKAMTIHRLHSQCFAPGQGDYWRLGEISASLNRPDGWALLVSIAGTPAAYGLFRQVLDECEILSLGVAPAYRRSGLASVLLGAALAQAGSRGIGRWLLEVRADNRAGRRLYARHGFRAVGRRPGYYRDLGQSPKDAVTMICHTSLLNR